MDWMFKDKGHVISQKETKLLPRDNTIIYEPGKHKKELSGTVQWRDCPAWAQPIIQDILEEFYDIFAQEGMQR
jgi:hypothetical protein